MRVIGLFLVGMLFVSINFAFAQSDSILMITDKQTYSQGETIHVSGNVKENHFGSELNFMILSQGGDVVLIKNLPVNNKEFETFVKVDKNILPLSGVYSVLARYGSETDTSQITINYKEPKNFLGLDEPKRNVLLNFDFIKSNKKSIQEHVDYKITILKNGVEVYGPTPIIHSSTGSVSLPLVVIDGQPYDVLIEVYGILFQKSSVESASFTIMSRSQTIQSDFTSKNGLKINIAMDKDPSPDPKIIPEWVKNTAKWWALGQIDDNSFTLAIEYLIQNKIMNIPDLPYPASWMDKSVPEWVKNNASWWADDLIQEEDFIKGIRFLVEKGVIQINTV